MIWYIIMIQFSSLWHDHGESWIYQVIQVEKYCFRCFLFSYLCFIRWFFSSVCNEVVYGIVWLISGITYYVEPHVFDHLPDLSVLNFLYGSGVVSFSMSQLIFAIWKCCPNRGWRTIARWGPVVKWWKRWFFSMVSPWKWVGSTMEFSRSQLNLCILGTSPALAEEKFTFALGLEDRCLSHGGEAVWRFRENGSIHWWIIQLFIRKTT